MSPLPIRAAADILQYLARPENRDVTLFVSCFEIYGNKIFDLLNQVCWGLGVVHGAAAAACQEQHTPLDPLR